MHLVNGTGNSPSPGRPTPGVVKQDKSSGGSADTTKPRSDPQRVGIRLATNVYQLRRDPMEQGPTEPRARCSTILLSSGGAGGGYY